MKKIALLFFLLTTRCLAQEVSFKPLRYDENYAALKNDTGTNWYHRLKYKPLSKNGAEYLSIGGEVRYQYFYYQHQDWGEAPVDRDGFILTRYLGHVDFHAGNHFRTFVQFQSGLANGQVDKPSPVDQNLLDLHQAFADYAIDLRATKLTLRAGRQELAYGSQRLIAVREAPNNRQAFDGARIMLSSGQFKLDGFYARYVQARPGIFDDRFGHAIRLWGIYGTFTKIPLLQNIDLYYLGLDKKSAVYDDGAGTESRHSIGARIWQTQRGLKYDVEGLFQFGRLASASISAWTLSANLWYTVEDPALKPQFGLKTELVSGDRNYSDGRLNTFNPLFPKGAYFGLAALIGPYNLLDTHPYVQINLGKRTTLAADYDLFWRLTRNDGLYAVNGALMYSGRDGDSKKIGRQLGLELAYSVNKFLYLRQELTWFNAGTYLKEAGPGKDILMLGTTVTLRF